MLSLPGWVSLKKNIFCWMYHVTLSGILESQEHIIDCDIFETKPDINYNDIFCDDMQKVKTALTEFQKAWNEWQEN